MKTISAFAFFKDSNYTLLAFFLFMSLCGFITGTRIWVCTDFSSCNFCTVTAHDFYSMLLYIILPSALVFLLMLFLSFFAIWWLIQPLFVYLLSSVGGLVVCSLFSVPVSSVSLLTILSLSLCFICTLFIICLFSVFSYTLSRQLYNAEITNGAYIYFCKNSISILFVLLLSDTLFALLIFLQTFLFYQKE